MIASLIAAAHESIAIEPDPRTGLRPGDPLRAALPDELDAAGPQRALALNVARQAVESITGRPVSLEGPGNMAARLRSELRRYALANPQSAPVGEVKP